MGVCVWITLPSLCVRLVTPGQAQCSPLYTPVVSITKICARFSVWETSKKCRSTMPISIAIEITTKSTIKKYYTYIYIQQLAFFMLS